MVGPCFCIPLKVGTIILAITDAVLNGVLLLTLIFVGSMVIHPNNSEMGMAICIAAIVLCICQILLALELGRVVKNHDAHGMRRWLIIIVVVLAALTANVSIKFVYMPMNLDMPFGIVGIISVIFKLYEMLVVVCYMKEVNSTETQNSHSVNNIS